MITQTQTPIECPANHVCTPPIGMGWALSIVFITGIFTGFFARSVSKLLKSGANLLQTVAPGVANSSPIDEWAIGLAKILDQHLPGQEPLQVEQIAELLKNPSIAAGLMVRSNVQDFRESLNDRCVNTTPKNHEH